MASDQFNNLQKLRTLEQWAGSGFPTLALVFTDIIDSTKLALSVGDPDWIKMVRQHFDRGRELISRHDGREIKLIGDAFMVVFHNAVDAFGFVLGLQEDTGHPDIKIRAGIHVGGVRVIENDIFGIEVNRAKRVESMTKNPMRRAVRGQRLMITISDPAYTQIANEKDAKHDALHFEGVPLTLPSFSKQETIWFVYKLNMPQGRLQGRGTRPMAQSVTSTQPNTPPRRLLKPLDSITLATDKTVPKIEPLQPRWISSLLKDEKKK